MRFSLVDRILEVEPGRRIRAVKNLTLGEEYLADHFPTFPVMPGVLMLQTLVEASSWLLRISDEFRYSVVVLREAKNVKFGQFMVPGRQMIAFAEIVEDNGVQSILKAKGEADGQQTVSARISLARYNVGNGLQDFAGLNERIAAHWRGTYALLIGSGKAGLAGT